MIMLLVQRITFKNNEIQRMWSYANDIKKYEPNDKFIQLLDSVNSIRSNREVDINTERRAKIIIISTWAGYIFNKDIGKKYFKDKYEFMWYMEWYGYSHLFGAGSAKEGEDIGYTGALDLFGLSLRDLDRVNCVEARKVAVNLVNCVLEYVIPHRYHMEYDLPYFDDEVDDINRVL